MQHRHQDHGIIMTLLCVIFGILLLVDIDQVEATKWHHGCFNLTSEGNETSVKLSGIVPCCQSCLQQGYPFVGVNPTTRCQCLTDVSNLTSSVAKHCNSSCPLGEPSLPCGGDCVVSVYHTRGPYLLHARATTDGVVVEGRKTAIQVLVQFASVPTIELGAGAEDATAAQLVFVWSAGEDGGHTERVEADEELEQAAWITQFKRPGLHTIDIHVSNLLSNISLQVNMTVVTAVPTDLQLSLVTDDDQLPTCVSGQARDEVTSVPVFRGIPVIFEASVATGANLTFEWTFTDDPAGSERVQKMWCEGRNCSTSTMEHAFAAIGQFEVKVRVSNIFDSLETVLHVIVLHQHIQQLDFALLPNATAVSTPHENIGFVITLVTASRRDTFLEVNFGDGTLAKYCVKEENGSLIGLENAPGGDYIYLVGNYGEECELVLEIDHKYTHEGEFVPSAKGLNAHSEILKHLASTLVIENRLQTASLIHSPVVALGVPVTFSVNFGTRSAGAHFHWMVEVDGGHQENITTVLPVLTHTFDTCGVHQVAVNASNRINSVSATSSVTVEEPIDGVAVTTASKFVCVGQSVDICATVVAGSNLDFKWNFPESADDETQIVNVNMSSIATRVFSSPGVYNVTVTVTNMLHGVTVSLPFLLSVQELITGLALMPSAPTILANMTTFVATVVQGSHVRFRFRFGAEADITEVTTTNKSVTVQHKFDDAGRYEVTAYAVNDVSEESRSVTVIVEAAVRHVSIETNPTVAIGEHTPFYAHLNGTLSLREDVVYKWRIDNETVVFSRVPVMTAFFGDTTPRHVQLTVYNLVSSEESSCDVSVRQTSDATHFSQTAVCHLQEQVHFHLLSLPRDTTKIHVNYGDMSQHTITNVPNSDSYRWEHLYGSTGLYQVTATCVTQSKGSMTVSSWVSVQQPVTDLTVNGPKAIPAASSGQEVLWTASLESGTDVLYKWTVDAFSTVTTSNKLSWKFSVAGSHTLTVTAFNQVNNIGTSLEVIVQHPMSSVSLRIPPVVQGADTNIFVTLQGSRHFRVDVDFGDANKTTILSSDPRVCKTERSKSNSSVQFKLAISHTYTESGHFNVSVNVSNLISHKVTSKTALVGEPIEGIIMTTEAGPIIMVNKVVVVKATVASGKNLTFEWDFSDSVLSTVISAGNTSVAKHVFRTAGVYAVKLRLLNPLYTDPVVAQLPFDLEAIEAVDTLEVSELNGRTSANLTRMATGNYTTRKIKFVARAERGSDVTFTFDFGDGIRQVVGSAYDTFFHNLFGQVTHRYTKVGSYQVSVTAHNPLGNTTASLPQLFYVQVPPSGLALNERVAYHTLLGNSTFFQASLSGGTRVHFDWDMGDQTEYYYDAGTMKVHRYRAVGVYTVTVKAYNKVGSEQVEVRVKVDEMIQEVVLTVDKVLHSTGTPVTFTATVFPKRRLSGTSTYYKWDFGEIDKPIIGNFKDVEKHVYRRHGKYTVRVTASNDFSSVTSEPLQVQFVDALSELKIFLQGETVVGREITFEAYVFKGSNIVYYWDFGDNTTYETSFSRMRHTYSRTGKFLMRVIAVNELGNKTAAQPVFILSKMCKPPDILMLGDKGRQVHRTNELKIEAKVAINCSITSLAIYTWTFRNGTTREVILEDHEFHDPVLLLPRMKLGYGNYSIELKVEMAGTIVYSSAETYLFVVPKMLLAIINGGIQRYVSRKDLLVMNGSMSHDPDFRAANDLSFNWTCYVLLSRDMSCFIDNSSTWVDSSNKTLTIPGSQFKPDIEDFVFTLTVSKAGRASSNITQVLQMKRQAVLEVSVNCALCEDGLVNADRRLILQAGHHGRREEELEFEWQLYFIADGSTSVGAHNRASCVEADGSSYRSMTANSTTAPPMLTPTSTTTAATTTTTATPTTTATTTTTAKHASSTTLRGVSGRSSQPFVSTTPSTTTTTHDWFNPGEGAAAAAGRSGFSDFGILEGESPADSGGTRSWPFGGTASGGQTGQTVEGATEGRGSGRDQGSGQGRVPPSGADGGGMGGQGGSGKKDPDPVVPQQNVVRFDPHIVSKVRYSVVLKPSQTTTGLHQRALVIKRGVFKQGRTYIIQLKVKHKGSRLQGTALAYFKVNESPSHGDCTIKPEVGVEMETDFRIFCKAWKDPEMPLSYEVSYNLSEGPRDLLYQGLDHVIISHLPAGQPSNGYRVELHISILDSLGARTSVCSLPIKVTPRSLARGNQTEEDILYGLVREGHSTLHTYVQEGDNRAARLHSQIVATRLNRLDATSDPAPVKKRRQIRTALLATLKGLPLRDEYEVQQTASAMRSSTAVTNELSGESVKYASDILANLTKRMYHISADSSHLDQSISVAALETTANILTAVSTSGNMTRHEAKEIVSTSTRAIEKILQTELLATVLGEEPFIKTSRKLSVSAGRFKTSVLPPTLIESAYFKMPSDMRAVMKVVKRVNERQRKLVMDEGCYEAHTVVFADNLYSFGQTSDNAVQTPVASLTLFSCHGQQLKVTNLTGTDQIKMSLQNQMELDAGNYSLKKQMMNVHIMNVSRQEHDQYFHISVQLKPVSSGRLFPVTILIRQGMAPTPKQHWKKWQFGADENLLDVFLPPNTLNHSTTYYVGIVDSDYNAGRPREGEVQRRDYSLRMWWSQCLYWEETAQHWATDGCSVQSSSSYHTAHCSCSHLTSFGAHFNLMPNDLNFIDIEDFFDVNENPVCVALVVTLLAIYFVMLYLCIRCDLHDKKKGSLVHLVDNLAKFQQRYIITFETGFRKGAGTTAKVSIVLHGEEGMSETRELVSKTGQPLFERNSRDTFVVMLPENLGRIWKVQIWHNNAGLSPSWYLSRVSVFDTGTGNTYYFNCEKWFAVEEEDGKVEREIMAVEGGLGFRKVLWAKGTQYFADLHVWFSTLTRPSYSRFTRAQRLTCCLSLLMSYLAVNAAWYKTSMQEYRGEFGLIDVSWRTVIVGVINSLLVLPVNLLIVLLFRRSKVQRVEEDAVEETYDYSKRESIMSLESDLLQPALAPSIFDQSILNWQSLQEWAQKTWAKHHQQSVDSSGVQPIYEQKPDDDRLTTASHHNNRDSGLSSDHTEHLDDMSEESRTDSGSQKHEKTTHSADDHNKVKTSCDKGSDDRLSEKSFYDEGRHSAKPGRVFLPCCFTYFGWVLAWVVIVGCSSVTILYGFRFGRTKSILWLQSLVFSFIQSVFITHPILILLLSIYVAVKYKNSMAIFDHYDDGWIIVHRRSKESEHSSSTPTHLSKAEEAELDLTMGVAARQRSRYLRFARPPQEKQLIESRKKIIKEKVASYVLSEGFHIGLQFLLLILMVFGKDTSTPCILNTSLSNTFVRSGETPFVAINSMPAWWKWLQTDFLDTVYWDQWYNGQATSSLEKGYIGGNVLIGQVIVRQRRQKQESCELPYPYMSHLCHYDHRRTDSAASIGGKKSSAVYENFGYYEGDGFLVTLGNNRSDVYRLLLQLQHGNWVNKYTKQLTVELTLFYAPSNLFSSVKLWLDVPPSGGVSPHYHVTSTYLYRYMGVLDNIVLACELLFIIVTLLGVRSEVMQAVWQRKQYLKSIWNCVQVTLCTVALSFIGCFIYRFILVQEKVEELRATYHSQYVDVSHIAFWDHILRSLIGLLLFLTILQVLKLLCHQRPFVIYSSVLRHAASDIVVFGAVFVIWVCAYVSMGMALYGSISHNFSSVATAVQSIAGLLTGHYDFNELDGSQDYWRSLGWRLFVVSFLLLALGSLTAYIIAALTFHIRVYKHSSKLVLSPLETLRYYWRHLLLRLHIKRTYSDDEDSVVLPPEFVMAEIEYQVDEMLFKMNALAGTSNLPEKPPIYFTDSDGTYGLGEDAISTGSEMQPYDDDRYEHHLHHMHHDTGGALFHFDHQLSHLMQHGNLADISEKQLRSQLEFETLCHLQMAQQQQPSNMITYPGGVGYQQQANKVGYHSNIRYHKALSSSSSNVSASHSSTDVPPSSSLTSTDRDSGHASPSEHSSHAAGSGEPGREVVRKTEMDPEDEVVRHLGEISPDFQHCHCPTNQDSQDSIPLEDFSTRTNSWPGSTETTLNQSDSTGDSTNWSGGVEVCSMLSHDSRDSLAGKESFSRHSLADKESLSRDNLTGKEALSRDNLADKEALSRDNLTGKEALSRDNLTGKEALSRDNLTGKEALGRDNLAGKEALSRDNLTGKEALGRDNLAGKVSHSRDSLAGKECLSRGSLTVPSHHSLAHQSSSSEHDSFPHHPKARCLRKTKSRGKGKGCLSPGLDELGFDNDAYSSDSSCENGGSKDLLRKGPKECWT